MNKPTDDNPLLTAIFKTLFYALLWLLPAAWIFGDPDGFLRFMDRVSLWGTWLAIAIILIWLLAPAIRNWRITLPALLLWFIWPGDGDQ